VLGEQRASQSSTSEKKPHLIGELKGKLLKMQSNPLSLAHICPKSKKQGPDLPKKQGPDLPKKQGPDLSKKQGPDLSKKQGPDLAETAKETQENEMSKPPSPHSRPSGSRLVRPAPPPRPAQREWSKANRSVESLYVGVEEMHPERSTGALPLPTHPDPSTSTNPGTAGTVESLYVGVEEMHLRPEGSTGGALPLPARAGQPEQPYAQTDSGSTGTLESLYVDVEEMQLHPEGNTGPQPLGDGYYESPSLRHEGDSKPPEDCKIAGVEASGSLDDNYIKIELTNQSSSSSSSSKARRSRKNRWEIDYGELEIDKRIGQGAYGSVYKGKWRNTEVAIKTIRENMDSFQDSMLDEFHAEAEMMMDMRPHTNVVQLFGVCVSPKMAIVVEFLEGGSLQDLLRSKEDFNLRMALKIALHAAAGVAHLHAEGICHRDLAARNLLLTSRNKDYFVVKVADFGLSRFTEDAEDNFTKCKVGPLKWMPPESLREQKYSFKSDAWAMGVVLWEIFARQEPFPNVSPVQVAIGVSSQGMCLKPPACCPEGITQLMYDCWSYDPKDRPEFRSITRSIEQVIASNPPNISIVPNTNEPFMCTHPERAQSP